MNKVRICAYIIVAAIIFSAGFFVGETSPDRFSVKYAITDSVRVVDMREGASESRVVILTTEMVALELADASFLMGICLIADIKEIIAQVNQYRVIKLNNVQTI